LQSGSRKAVDEIGRQVKTPGHTVKPVNDPWFADRMVLAQRDVI